MVFTSVSKVTDFASTTVHDCQKNWHGFLLFIRSKIKTNHDLLALPMPWFSYMPVIPLSLDWSLKGVSFVRLLFVALGKVGARSENVNSMNDALQKPHY